ncbi:MAG: glycoside hydrolase family 3 C-terminal domain-containing protein, partial [Kiritimatiellae bacterium]|nr:glycoside hydrolase family 3 C-terminal domain-containing protein [Kiritimatiellia bacterium]
MNLTKISAAMCFALLATAGVADEPGEGQALSPEIAMRHQTVARRAAAEGMVLLDNNGALPLAKGSKIALFGEWRDYKTGGGGSSRVKPSRLVGFADGLAEAGFSVDPESRDAAVYVLYRAAGENRDMERLDYEVSAKEVAALKALREQGFAKVVLVVNGGVLPNVRPLVEDGVVDAALFTWYPGQEGCAAIG